MATTHTISPVAELKARVEMLHQEGEHAFNKHDLEKMVSFYSPDASVMAPNLPPANGTKEIRDLYREAIGSGWTNFKTKITRIVTTNELVVTSGSYSIDLPSAKLNDRGKFVSIYQVLNNGDCKVILDIWNSDLPPFPMPNK